MARTIGAKSKTPVEKALIKKAEIFALWENLRTQWKEMLVLTKNGTKENLLDIFQRHKDFEKMLGKVPLEIVLQELNLSCSRPRRSGRRF